MSSGGLFWTNLDSPMSFDKSETNESLLREPKDSIVVASTQETEESLTASVTLTTQFYTEVYITFLSFFFF